MNYLFQHINQPEYQVLSRRTLEAITISDNSCTRYYGIADCLPHERVVHRVMVVSDSMLVNLILSSQNLLLEVLREPTQLAQ